MWSNLVLSGGGLAAITYFGCLKYINENKGMKQHIKNILGVSSGSIFSLLLVLGCSLDDCKSWLSDVKDMNLNRINLKSLVTLKSEYGLDNGDGVQNAVKKLLDRMKVDHDITFKQISQIYGKNLIVCSANITTKALFYFSVDTTPESSVLDAIKASTSIPLVFTPYVLNDEYHVDPFVYDNFPFHFFENTEHTIGLNLTTCSTTNNNFMNFFTNIFNSVIYYNSVKKHKNECMLVGQGSGFDLRKMRFAIDDNTVDQQIEYGYETLKEFVEIRIKKSQQSFESDP